MTNFFQPLAPFAWPIAALLLVVFLAWWLCSDLRPIVTGVIGGIAAHAQKYAPSYGIAVLLGLAASHQALAEVAEKLGWVYAGAIAKVMQPGIVAMIGFIMRSPSQTQGGDNPPGGTKP